jgi:beta-phosphoglucomutase-like phosphatase (HAD superfamily)
MKTVVFDLDGVLLDFVGLDMAISVRVFKKFRYSITKPDEYKYPTHYNISCYKE